MSEIKERKKYSVNRKSSYYYVNTELIYILWHDNEYISVVATVNCEIFIFKPPDEKYKSCTHRKNLNVMYLLWWLILNAFVHCVFHRESTTKSQTARCRTFVYDARQTACFRAASCGDVTLSLDSYRRIGDMFKRHGDIETTRPMTTRRLACFVRDKTTV
jgi:hypothetical protein